MNLARRCSGQFVIVCVASLMVPVSTMKEPATALRRVDLPDPFVPMMIRKDPGASVKETSDSARTSLGVAGLKVLNIRWISNIALGHPHGRRAARTHALGEIRHHKRSEHKDRGDQLEIVWIQAPAQSDRNEQAE